MTKPENDKRKRILIVEDQFVEAYDLQLILEKAGYEITGIAHSAQMAKELIRGKKPDLVCLDIFLQGKETGIDLARRLKEDNIGFIYISANSSKKVLDLAKETQPYGFMVKPFREQDVLATLEIACYRHRHNLEFMLGQIGTLQKSIVAIGANGGPFDQSLLQLAAILQPHVPFDYIEWQGDAPAAHTGLLCRNHTEYINADPGLRDGGDTKFVDAKNVEEPEMYNGVSFNDLCMASPGVQWLAENFGIRSMVAVPVKPGNTRTEMLLLCSRQGDGYSGEHLLLLSSLATAFSRFAATTTSVAGESGRQEMPAWTNAPEVFDGMVGNSRKMASVSSYIRKVAPSETSVLILGESGTGKEKVAHCIHNLSPRKEEPFIVINCGAIPEKLAESILFGHEKGAFTGAAERQIGKFELADRGTIFLDEIGEMPIDLQVKLLRVLQEMEIERVGGRSPVKINTRIIAATNKNLEEEVAAGRFRMDLYYRLYVFPITVPALRERKEDIPALAAHFIKLYCNKMGRQKMALCETLKERMFLYNWPGNIRQLEHLIQRSILLTEGPVIEEMDIPVQQDYMPGAEQHFTVKTILENERDYISAILKKCKGKVYGAGGAAELLDIPPSTLASKIKKLGIQLKVF